MRVKYPRTFHLPWSPGATSDDKKLLTTEMFVGKEVVVTEKLDGENTTIYSDGFMHARSTSGAFHESQTWIKKLAAETAHNIPFNLRICGENVFAKHSIHYQELETYFYVFGMFDKEIALSWNDVEEYAALLELKTVPVLYRGIWNEDLIKQLFTGKSKLGGQQEGYVVRNAESFLMEKFSDNVAKFVRTNHVDKNSKHWSTTKIVQNILKSEAENGLVQR